MTATNPSSLKATRKLLGQEFTGVGLKSSEVFKILPDWWEEAIEHPSGVFEVRGFVAKHFGLMLGPDARLCPRPPVPTCFKTRNGTDVSKMASARALAGAVANLIAARTIPPWRGTLPSARNLRAEAVTRNLTPWVGLLDLLEACWSHGVPVVYLPTLPVTTPKMDGMVTRCGGRPVIILTKKASAPAWMLFVLAHEMGHIALDHLESQEGSSIIDEDVSEDGKGKDDQEKQADAYAIQLLTDGKNFSLSGPSHFPRELATAAILKGRSDGIDPGHLILNAAKHTASDQTDPWKLAGAALKFIGEKTSPDDLCRRLLCKNIDQDALSDDSFEFLKHLHLL